MERASSLGVRDVLHEPFGLAPLGSRASIRSRSASLAASRRAPTLKASLIAGAALSTTSLAVVYAVLVEASLNTTRVGKLIMSACFVTDMATAIALSALFITPNGCTRPSTRRSRR
jgi:hypothetical protein